MRIFIAPGVLDAPTCRRVQAAMDAGTPEEAEVLDEGFAVQEDVRRATQIDVADTVLTMVEATLDAMRVPIASFYGLALQSREGASITCVTRLAASTDPTSIARTSRHGR